MRVSQSWGYLVVRCPHNKDNSISGSILQGPHPGNLPHDWNNNLEVHQAVLRTKKLTGTVLRVLQARRLPHISSCLKLLFKFHVRLVSSFGATPFCGEPGSHVYPASKDFWSRRRLYDFRLYPKAPMQFILGFITG